MEKVKEELKYNKKGITLISLVVTIIVLLILAGVSISMLTGQNGILNRASEAKEKTDEANVEEQRKLAQAEAMLNLEETEYQGITIPAGFAPTGIEGESTIDEGLVITDSNGNEYVWIEVPNDGTGPDYTSVTSSTDYDQIASALQIYVGDYRKGAAFQECNWTDTWYAMYGDTLVDENTTGLTEEQKALNNGCGLTYNEYKNLYHTMLTSVYENGGFYIGRYEAGIEGSDEDTSLARTSYTDITTSSIPAVSKQNCTPYNYVYCSEAQTLANKVNSGDCASSLMFGIQWDLVMKYLEVNGTTYEDLAGANPKTSGIGSTSWGNYMDNPRTITKASAKYSLDFGASWIIGAYGTKSSSSKILLSTGADESFSKMNIYDLAGNVFEWTLEESSDTDSPCSVRGGNYSMKGCEGPASYRNTYTTNHNGRGYVRFSHLTLLRCLKSNIM